MSNYSKNDPNSSLNTTQNLQQKKRQKENPNYQQQKLQKIPLTSEDTTISKNISAVEMQCLKRVFVVLCSQTSLSEYQLYSTKFSDKSVYSQMNSKYQVNNNDNNEQIKEFFTWKDLMSVLNELEYEISKPEVEELIWEVNESLNGKIDWYEFELMYKRKTLNQDFWIEPGDLFYIVEFLMFLQKYVESVQHQEQNNKNLNKNDSDYEDDEQDEEDLQESQEKQQQSIVKEDQNEAKTMKKTNYSQDNNNLQSTLNNNKLQRPSKKAKYNGFANDNKSNMNKIFFEKIQVGYDSALELLFIRYGREKVSDLIWDIFKVDMDNNKDSDDKATGIERYDKTITLKQYLAIMKQKEFQYQKKLQKDNIDYFNNYLLEQQKQQIKKPKHNY